MLKVIGLFVFICVVVPFYMCFLKYGEIQFGDYISNFTFAGLLISSFILVMFLFKKHYML